MRFAVGLLAASILAGIHASPISTVEPDTLASRDASIDAELFTKLKYYVQYAAAAYCDNNGDSSGTPIVCSTGNCPDVQAAEATSILEFDDSLIAGIQGFVSTSAPRAEIVLSFRGSASVRNFITDANFLLVPFGGCPGCAAHAGFVTAWKEPRAAILAAIDAARAANPSYKLVITGHSLGGAVATLAAADLRARGYAADLFNYGSPRTGNRQFAEFVSAQPGVNARVTRINDPVPRLPPLLVTPFRHTTPEYWLSTGAPTYTQNVIGDVKVCVGTASVGCNAGTKPTLDFDTHRYYFEYTSQCAPDLAFRKREPMSPARRGEVKKEVSDEQLLEWMKMDAEHGGEIDG